MPTRNTPEKMHLLIPRSRFNSRKKAPRRYIPPSFNYTPDDRERISEKLANDFHTMVDLDATYKDANLSAYVFKIVTHNDINLITTKKNLGCLGFVWLNPIDLHQVVVSLSKEKKQQLEIKIEKYGKEGRLHSYIDGISGIEIIGAGTKISPKIEAAEESKKLNTEVDFYAGLGLEDYEKSIEYVARIIGKEDIYYRKTMPEMPFIRLKATKQEIKKIVASLPSIKKIELVSRMQLAIASPKKIEDVEFEAAAEDLKSIMVIDCGVNHEHPGIKNVLIFRKSYTKRPSTADTDPEHAGHGTGVAGLAAYGMISNINPKRLSPTSKIGVAKILDDDESNETPIEDFLENIINDGITKAIRIYSLTVMYPAPVKEISKLASVIDTLSRKYNILFIISTGNLSVQDIQQFYQTGLVYPSYLDNNEKSKIFEGAEACCALTVGGIAHIDNNNSIAKRYQASPFTRAGPTPDDRLKPDLVHYAGNMSQIFDYPEDLSLLSLNYQPEKGVYFVKNVGTSFSTPIVANMASQILAAYPDASPNLIRALLVHGSDIRGEFENVAEPRFVYGFGFPDIHSSIKSTIYAPTLIFEGEVGADEYAEVRIPVPKEIGRSKGSKFMKITLAYDPPVSFKDSNINYALVNLSFSIWRKNESGYTRINGEDRGWLLKHYRQIQNNTIKKDRYQWERGHAGEDWIIRIEPSAKIEKKSLSKQKFALVVTIEDSRHETDLYTPVMEIFEEEKAKIALAVPALRPQAQTSSKRK